MEYRLNSTPEDLKRLTRRIADISEDLQKDTVEIQYLLSQLSAAVSGSDTMIHAAMGNIDHCRQLCQTLDEISVFLKSASASYSAAENKAVARLQGLQTGRVFS